MKKILFASILLLTSCRGCVTTFSERKASVQKICPTCTFVMSEGQYFAVDTLTKPNVIYKVRFKEGGLYYKASDVDNLVRVN